MSIISGRRVAWRIVREALWDSNERKRLYHEAVDFLKLRAERVKWARRGGDSPETIVGAWELRLPAGTTRPHRMMHEHRLRIKTLFTVFLMVVCANIG